MVEFTLGNFDRTVVGETVIYNNAKLFEAGIFPERVDKNGNVLEVTEYHLDSIVRNFDGDIGGNVQHTNYLRGRAGTLSKVWKDKNELRGVISLPKWFDEFLIDEEKKISVELDPDTFETLKGFALCTNPRVTTAKLMTAFEDFKKSPHNTYPGQRQIQLVHDSVASSAICNPPKDSAGDMASKHELKALQAIHDLSVEHGASCDSYSMFSNSDELQHSTSTSKEVPDITVEPIKPTTLKESKLMSIWDEVKALFVKHKIEVPDEETKVLDPSGVIDTIVPVVEVKPTEEFSKVNGELETLKIEHAKLVEKNKKAEDDLSLSFSIQNASFIDALISEGKIEPKDRDEMILARSKGPEAFDASAKLLPVKEEYKESTPTITGEEMVSRLKGDPKKQETFQKDIEKLKSVTGGIF